MFKNVASQKIELYAYDSATGLPKTGDAANITMYVSKDHGSVTALTDTSATEMDATNAKGVYVCDVAQAESNADQLTFSGKSSTSGIFVSPRFIETVAPNANVLAVDSSGRVDLGKWLGSAPNALVGGKIDSLNNVRSATAQAGAASTITLDASASAVDNAYKGQFVQIISGTGVGQTRNVISYVGSTKVATVGLAWTTNPDNTSVFAITAFGNVSILSSIKKNQALTGFTFVMTNSTTHAPQTGLTVTAQRSIDGAAVASCANSVSEIGSSTLYKLDLAATDMNGSIVALLFTATGADTRIIVLLTVQ